MTNQAEVMDSTTGQKILAEAIVNMIRKIEPSTPILIVTAATLSCLCIMLHYYLCKQQSTQDKTPAADIEMGPLESPTKKIF